MINQDWMRFEHTGRVADYLAYSKAEGGAASKIGNAGIEMGHTGADTGRDLKESEARDGADHCAYRYGAGSHTHRGL